MIERTTGSPIARPNYSRIHDQLSGIAIANHLRPGLVVVLANELHVRDRKIDTENHAIQNRVDKGTNAPQGRLVIGCGKVVLEVPFASGRYGLVDVYYAIVFGCP